MGIVARQKWVRPKDYVQKPAKPCRDCGRLIRWRKLGDEWWCFDLSGGEHWRYCEPQRWEPLGELKTWQGGKR